ncbi:hypothetical protein CPB84DRAFT_379523 [Gymnopilus junonius]|uniref:Uncharacterized protein n=1 Tax=Gymnopilus junonius TaxID=109634 RepID=A0A9P5THW1_GYMJU|nr:hypothetical protein CPB84DRAFT_379523 [Gymnopilus junonius]
MVYYGAQRLRCDTSIEPTSSIASLGTPTLSGPKIPPELFHPIVSFITSRPTLLTLCITSQTLRHYAERCLYTSISGPDASNAPLHIGFLRTITQTPRLARYVKEYYSLSIVVYQENPLWDLTKQAFKCMINLKTLVFRGFGGHPCGELLDMDPSSPSSPSLTPTLQLEKLMWGNHSDERSISKILIQQSPSLRELSFGCRPRAAPFSPHACPKLDALWGNRAAIEALLPGRHITRLSWVPELDDSNTDPILGLDEELGALRTLSFGGYFSRPHLELIVGFLSGLEVLEMVGLFPGVRTPLLHHPHLPILSLLFSNSHSPSSPPPHPEQELPLLKSLPSLRELVFSLRWGVAQFPIPLKGRKQEMNRLFAECSMLACVDIVHEWVQVDLDTILYQRWEREGGEPRLVTRGEVRKGRF